MNARDQLLPISGVEIELVGLELEAVGEKLGRGPRLGERVEIVLSRRLGDQLLDLDSAARRSDARGWCTSVTTSHPR